MAPIPRGVQTAWCSSLCRNANTKLPNPANSTCQEVAPKVGGPDCHFFDSTEPNAQLKEPPIRAMDHHNSLLPTSPLALSLGQSKIPVPISPRPSPTSPLPDTRWCPNI